MSSNRKSGNDFETHFCELLSKEGFWVHNLAQNAAGQPADVIAVRNGRAFLIDCKVCSDNSFKLSRIESNQELAMTLWQKCGNHAAWFALLIDNDIYMLSHNVIKYVPKSLLSLKYIQQCGTKLEEWVNICS